MERGASFDEMEVDGAGVLCDALVSLVLTSVVPEDRDYRSRSCFCAHEDVRNAKLTPTGVGIPEHSRDECSSVHRVSSRSSRRRHVTTRLTRGCSRDTSGQLTIVLSSQFVRNSWLETRRRDGSDPFIQAVH